MECIVERGYIMHEWLSQGWGYLIALAAGIGAIVSLSQNIKKLAEKLNEPNKRQDAKIEALETKVKDHNKNIDDRVGVLEEAMACMIRDKINYYFEKSITRGYITPTDYEIVEKFGEAYFKLGGNGIIHKEMEAIERLPIHEQD